MFTRMVDRLVSRRFVQTGAATLSKTLLGGVAMLCASLGLSHAAMPQDSQHQTLGVVNCTSSMCHGATEAWKDSRILHTEYTTWVRLDRHARAYNVLMNDVSKRIAKKMGLEKPAHESKICLDCHAHNPPADKRGERFVMSDGVSCEACHGPAEKWMKTHVAPNATHEQNIADGLYPTDRPVAMAQLCLSCHFGNENKLVTHRIMGAGHPRLSFDLDTFAAIQPPHYKFDDSKDGKGSRDGVQIWAIGQAIAARELLNTLVDPKRGHDGLFPELVLFDCHACHHPMSEKKWQPRTGTGPGRVRLNDSNLLMVRSIVKVVSPAQSAAFNAQILLVHKAVSGDPDAKGADPLVEARNLSAMLDAQIKQFEQFNFTRAELTKVLRNLIDEGLSNGYTDYAGAEQAFMAVSSVSSFLQKQGGVSASREVNSVLSSMRKTLANDERYSPDQFKSDLTKLKNLMAGQAATKVAEKG